MDWSHVDYLWINVMFLSAIWTLILTAPIHCRGSIWEQVMLNFSKSVLMKNELIYIFGLSVSKFSAFLEGEISLYILNALAVAVIASAHTHTLRTYLLLQRARSLSSLWRPTFILYCDLHESVSKAATHLNPPVSIPAFIQRVIINSASQCKFLSYNPVVVSGCFVLHAIDNTSLSQALKVSAVS